MLAVPKLPGGIQIRQLSSHIDRRLVWFCGALLSIDAFFIAVFVGYKIYKVLYNNSTPEIGYRWYIDRDWSYLEIFGYLKIMIIVCLLISIWWSRHRLIYVTFIAIFTFALLDDALQVHERFGRSIVNAFDLQSFAGLRAQDFGELIVWTTVAVPLLAGVLAAFAKSPQEDRSNGLLLLGAFAVLVMFAAVADIGHTALQGTFRGQDFFFIVLEDGGEQITLTLTCGLTLLIRHKLRSRTDAASR